LLNKLFLKKYLTQKECGKYICVNLALNCKAAKGKDFGAVVTRLQRTDYEQDCKQRMYEGILGVFSRFYGEFACK
jgi:hypothetical protein